MATLELVGRDEKLEVANDPGRLLREAALALCRLQDVEDGHIRKMIRTMLSIAAQRSVINRRDVFNGRAAAEPLSQRFDEAEAAIQSFLTATEEDVDPFVPVSPYAAAHTGFEVMLDSLGRARSRLVMTEINRKVELYVQRFRESDLPREPELSHFARSRLVDAGVWKWEQIAAMSDDDLLAIKGIGPKSVAQLREAGAV